MLRLLLASALVACALANGPLYPTPTYPPPSNTYPQYPPNTYPRYPPTSTPPSYDFSQQELQRAVDFANRVADELGFTNERAKVVKDQQTDLRKVLDNISNVIIPGIRDKAAEQREALDSILKNLNIKYHRLVDVESASAGESASGARNLALLKPLWDEIEELEESNWNQDGSLEKIRSLLDDAEDALNETLAATTGEAKDGLGSLTNQADSVIESINRRKCHRDSVVVKIDYTAGKGSAFLDIPPQVFNGSFPVLTCALHGFVTYVAKDKTYKASSGYPPVDPEDNQVSTLAISCKPLPNKVLVEVVDDSREGSSRFDHVYVEVRACRGGGGEKSAS